MNTAAVLTISDSSFQRRREDLSGPAVALAGPFFPEWRFRWLTRRFLEDLKAGAERRAAGSENRAP